MKDQCDIGIGWYWMVLDGIGWYWMVLDGIVYFVKTAAGLLAN